MCDYRYNPATASQDPVGKNTQEISSQIHRSLERMQRDHDSVCDCNKRYSLDGTYIGRYPNIVGGANPQGT
jgi:hypothetical protein